MHKHKSKSKSHRWGPWSEWTWDSTQQAKVRVRQDSEGHLDYEWDQQDLSPVGHAQTPRDAAVEDITERLNCLSPTTNEAHFDITEEYAYAGGSSEQSKTKQAKSKSKDKEKSHRRHTSSDGKSSTASQDDAAYTENSALQFVASPYGDEYQQHDPTNTVNYSKYGSARTTYRNEWSRPSRYTAFTEESEASSSQPTEAAQQCMGEGFAGTVAIYGEAQSGSEGSPTPQPETTVPVEGEHIPGIAEGGAGELDPRYRIEHSTRFQPGEIFKVHWSEPQGSMSEQSKSSSKKEDLQNKYGTKFFVGFRRFIVVANDQGHCTCVPILTYGGKACKKHGVKPEKHGIVYERGQKAKKLDGEPSLGFSPVRVEMTEEGEKITRESRVNYSKLVTVEHNVKVFFIGHVYPSDWQIVGDAVNHCWNKKIHQKQRHK
ncbi:hypothetical protein IF1G_01397 [Cordyceps javanica]|uniref:DUF6590 domain-containing protein n=1 Tax=Cordyceps javanica TaxID=43265 RepID=A0A545VBR3_9HYPO|nr:hypothetical protein IF1G_01397 [Cordyceps javanica]TQW11139.1 hypothetical protein IF2G_02081 [Cordyceps javanica]